MKVAIGALCVAAAALAQQMAQQTAGRSEIEKAIEEFRTQSRLLGLRAERTAAQRSPARPRFHGRLFENFRNDALDAVPHEVRQRGGTKSMLRRNQFGFNLTGPLIVPRLYDGARRTYFSVSYEGMRERIARSLLRTIPTMPERTGDWSQTVDQAGNPLPIYDPASTRSNPAFDRSRPVSRDNLEHLRDPFPGNRIPATRLDPVAQRALVHYPAPNASVGPFFRNNYFIHTPETNTADGVILRLDHAPAENHRLTANTSISNGFQGPAPWFPTAANPAQPEREFQNRRASLEHVLTISPRSVNSIGMEVSSNASTGGGSSRRNFARELGLAGVGGEGFPNFRMQPYLSMGRPYPISRTARNQYEWTASFSTKQGRHSWRIAGRYARSQVNTYYPQYPAGTFRFGEGLTSLPGIINTGHAFASFLLGLAEYAELSVVQSPSYFRGSSATATVRHAWELSDRLTFHWGLDFDLQTPRIEKYDRQSTVDLEATNPGNGRKGALIFAGRDGNGRSFQPVRMKLEPSAGFSWNPFGAPKTVLRASFARSYSGIPIYPVQWGTQGYNGTPTYISSNVQLEPAVKLAAGLPVPGRPLPDLRPDAANDTVADLMDRSRRQPVYQSASLSLEHEAPGSVVVTMGAAYSGGRDLLVGNWAANPNAIHPEALRFRDRLNDEQFHRSLRPYPQFKGFDVYSSWPLGRYHRDAGFLRVEKRASHGLTLSFYYEFSKQLDDYSGPYGRQDHFNRRNEWSLTAYNRPHTLSFSFVYELPFGPNKAVFAFADWRRHLVEGWSVSAISTYASGEPIALRPQFNNTGGVLSALNVDVVPGVNPRVAKRGPELWFNPLAFAHPADFSMGNASRTHPFLRNPSNQNHDLSLTKRFAVGRDRTLEFTAMGLNFINHANWEDPDNVIGPPSAPNVNAGRIIGSRGGRIIQLGLRYSF
ncbi:MAG: hypothetical protein RMI94_09935 [Bryobacterales bacterium]|nr:hypothetical protein [Bryobacteraceae bacterium]MDW8130856.1 hypothetical protein [Bryobacterales bacterium]